jgi:glycosyltransferase involved in cell wall biosynthesis
MTSIVLKPMKVGIVCHRFQTLGGMQTCLVELVSGLNDAGIVPSLIWDEPMDWNVLNAGHLETRHFPVHFVLSSSLLKRLPRSLAVRLERLRRVLTPLPLGEFDFVYSFEAGMERNFGGNGVVYTPGPQYVQVPSQLSIPPRRRPRNRVHGFNTFGGLYRCFPSARYITIAQWLAREFHTQRGVMADVIWPPSRERKAPLSQQSRNGVLFLSRITTEKRPFEILELARSLPQETVTIAGGSFESAQLVESLRETCAEQGLSNVEIVEDPTEDQVAGLMARHLVFVFPARWEHFGIVTVEAIRAGLLPIVHDSGGQREIVPTKELRFSTVREMVAIVRRAISWPENRRLQLIEQLQAAVLRSEPSRFRREMLGLMTGSSRIE